MKKLLNCFARRPFGLALLVAAAAGTDAAPADAAEWRAFWVDAWGAGFLNQSQVDTLLGVPGTSSKGQIREANCNAVFVQVRRRYDTAYPSGVGEPYMSGLSPADFNALQAMINAAHDTTGGKKRVEVHCWLVAFATAGGQVYTQHIGTPTGSLTNFDNYWPTRDDSGAETSDKAFDPGHPLVLQYLVNVCMDLVNNFDIDGIHYDYIRFTANNQGYNPTSIARYNARYGLTGQPAASDEQFKQWRRDQVTALVRQVYARIQKSKPWVKQSGSFVTWNPSPTSSTRAAFQATRPYYDVYSDWDSWLQEGIVDMAVPMTYYNWASLPSDYTRWMNFEKDRHGNRHMIIGPGIYLNSLSNAILELLMTRDPSPAGNYADGFCGYSYRVPYSGGTWAGFSPSLVSQVTPTWDDPPAMPWKTNPTTGHIMGTVTIAGTGAWADFTTVSVSGPVSRSMMVDGTGFYAFIDLPPGTYTVTATKTGYPVAQAPVTVAIGEVTGNMYEQNFVLGGSAPPVISNVQATGITNSAATITWTTDSASSSQVNYGLTTSYGSSSPLDNTPVTSHSVTISGLAANTLYHYRVISTNAYGTTNSADYTFTTAGPPTISNVQATNVTAGGATITWTTNTPANSQVRYGLTSSYGNQTALDPANVTAHSVTLSGLSPNTLYHYQAVSANAYGTAQSADFTFTTSGPPVISGVSATGIGSNGATITWTTDTPADSQVEYGTTVSYGSTTPLDATAVTSHSVVLSGLTPSTLYHYRVRSANAAGAVYSGDYTFTTTAFATEIVIDNTDPGWANTSPSGSWSVGTSSVVPKIGTNYLYAGASGSTSESSITVSCTWTPTIQQAGYYDVYVYYQIGANRNPSAPYKVFYNGGSVTSIQNQYSSTPNQGGWFLIGADLPFAVGTSGYVRCANNSADAGYISADAAKFVFKSAITPPPTITQQPAAQSVCPGGTATFTVAAGGAGTLAYQWQKNGANLSNGGHYSGVTTPTLTVSSADAGDAASYACVVTGDGGSTSSNAATLTLKAATTITQSPGARSVCPGGTTTFTVTATGDGPLSYQWQKNGANLSNGGHYSGATTAVLTVSGANADDAATYRCVVTGGCGSVASGEAALTLKAATTITQQPQPATVNAGGTAAFSVTATGDGSLSYAWQKNGADIGDDGHFTGATTATLTISNVAADDAGSYRCVVTAGCGSATSNAVTLTVNVPTFSPADFDRDGDVDLSDFNYFQLCFAGPNRPPAQPNCGFADLDADADVDLTDFARFQNCFNGPNRPAACP